MIEAVRDASDEVDDNGIPIAKDVIDKRLLVIEEELGSALSMKFRSGNTVSTVLRNMWHHGTQAPLTRKRNAIKTTDAHFCMVGHITKAELDSVLSHVEVHNGFANRILWVCVQQQKSDPAPRELTDTQLDNLGKRLAESIRFAHNNAPLLKRTETASEYWQQIYEAQLNSENEDQNDAFNALAARAAAQVTRLSIIFALLDCSETIEIEHLRAAESVWSYAEQSIQYLWGSYAPFLKNTDKVMDFLNDLIRLIRITFINFYI